MPLTDGQGNLGGEAGGNDTVNSTRESDLLLRKRKPVFEKTEINQSFQQGEQSYAAFTPDNSDGDATSSSGLEIQGYHHVFKKRKATTADLLSGTRMEELYVFPSKINSTSTSPVMTGDQHLPESKSKPPSPSKQTRPIGHLVNDCIGNTIPTTHREKGYTKSQAQQGFSRNTLDGTIDNNDNATEGSFVIITSHNGHGSQLFPPRTDSAPSSLSLTPATRSEITRFSPKHKEEKATEKSEAEVAENTHEQSTGSGCEGLIVDTRDPVSAEAYGSGERIMRMGGKNTAQAPRESRSKTDDGEYEFVEHPEPRSIQKFRQVPAIVRDLSDDVKHPVTVYADNWADSNFISSSIVKMLRFHERPLVGKDIVTYNSLTGSCTPKMYVRLELKLRGVSEEYKESFRVVDNDDFELIVGAATIQERCIPLQEHTARSAFTAFKRKPTNEQAATQQAAQEKDRQTALELSKHIPPYKTPPPATQSSHSAKDDPRNTPNSSTRTLTNSTTASGSTSASSSSWSTNSKVSSTTSSKNRLKG